MLTLTPMLFLLEFKTWCNLLRRPFLPAKKDGVISYKIFFKFGVTYFPNLLHLATRLLHPNRAKVKICRTLQTSYFDDQ